MLTFSHQLRLSSLMGLALALSLTPALAQSGASGGGSGGGSSTGRAGAAAGTSSGAGASGIDAAGSRSRAVRQEGAGGPRSGTPGTAAPNPALGSNPATGQSAVPSSNAGTSQSTSSGSTTGQGNLNAPIDNQSGTGAANSGATSGQTTNTQGQQPTSSSTFDRSQPGQQQGTLTTGGSSRREGAAGHDMQSCMEAWDARTHMTKAQWRRVCANTLSDRRGL